MRSFFHTLKQNRGAIVGGISASGVTSFVVAANADQTYPPLALSPGVKNTQPDWIKAGCGNAEYFWPQKGAVFPGDSQCPEVMPDLSQHNNLMTDALKKNPMLYDDLKHKTTEGGVGLAKCIKTGMDNRGHPHITTCGIVAGDEESYETFKPLFDEIIEKRHNGYKPDARHPTDMNPDNLSKTKIDPTCDADGNCKYVLTSRCRTGRSVRGLRLPPACTFEERRELERVIVKGLKNLEGELQGQYFPLHGSKSYPCAMDEVKEEQLRKNGNLFQEPDSTLLLSSGCGRHWPDARGIFHNEAQNFFVWVNEEDHMRIISMEKGDNIRAIFNRFANATTSIQDVLKKEGYDFMHNDHLGFILTCPSNLGTGLRAGAMVKVPQISSRPDFKKLLAKMGLQARGTAGVDSASTGGTWDISNADRLGKSETTLVNIFIDGVAQVIRWEQALEQGQNIDAEIASVMAGTQK